MYTETQSRGRSDCECGCLWDGHKSEAFFVHTDMLYNGNIAFG